LLVFFSRAPRGRDGGACSRGTYANSRDPNSGPNARRQSSGGDGFLVRYPDGAHGDDAIRGGDSRIPPGFNRRGGTQKRAMGGPERGHFWGGPVFSGEGPGAQLWLRGGKRQKKNRVAGKGPKKPKRKWARNVAWPRFPDIFEALANFSIGLLYKGDPKPTCSRKPRRWVGALSDGAQSHSSGIGGGGKIGGQP